jgi:hypothetical protein
LAYANLDYALTALNGARQVFRPEFYPVHYEHQARRVNVRYTCRGGSPTSDINRVCYDTERAAKAVNEALLADPSLHLALDHEDRWVIVRSMA